MKRAPVFLILLIGLQLSAQNYPISNISISLPNNLDANMAKWPIGTSIGQFSISALARMVNGRIENIVKDSRVLVSIKKSGSKICGAYNNNNAPAVGFNTTNKVWAGNNAISLIGQECVLQPGEYELCVQFFGDGPTGLMPLSSEKCKSFSIRNNEAVNYQAPQLVLPSNNFIFKTEDAKKPISFRWTPVVPKPQEPVIYKIRVWKLKKGESSTQAVKNSQPIYEKEIENLTHETINNLIVDGCSPSNACDFAWNVQALNRDGKPIGTNNGTSEAYSFNFEKVKIEYPVKLLSPANTSTHETNKIVRFTWKAPQPSEEVVSYKIKIVEIKGDQSPINAFKGNKPFFEKDFIIEYRGNKPFFERDSTPTIIFNYGTDLPKFREGKTYAWRVQAKDKEGKVVGGNDGWSECWGFVFSKREKETKQLCKNYIVNFVKNNNEKYLERCCYDLSIKNNDISNSNAVVSFRISSSNNINLVENLPNGWIQVSSNNTVGRNFVTFKKVTGYIPNGLINLNIICFSGIKEDPFYLTYEWLNKEGVVTCKDSIQISGCVTEICKNNLIRNGGFNLNTVGGIMPNSGTSQFWARGYGSPIIVNTLNDPNEGFIEKGFVKLSGNIANGQSIVQTLYPNNKIIAGKKYKLSVAIRFLNSQNTIDYGKIRAIAFNGSIYASTGIHPNPSTDVALIGRSSKIKDCNDWSVIEFPVWTANKNFSNIAINAFTNDGQIATVLIDNVTLCESAQESCNEVQTDENGNPIMPVGFGDVTTGFNCQAVAEEDDYYNGSLQDLYPGYNGTTDLYTQNSNSCYSIGGTLPQEVNNFSCDDSLKAAGIDMTCEELQALLNQEFVPTEIKKNIMPPIAPVANKICDRPMPKNMESMPFKGRDIIYIHGLQMDHIVDRANGEPGTTGRWPNNKNEYAMGHYYSNVAYSNMLPHIFHFLRNRGNLNRFIIVSYDCSETAEVAVHAVLTQIREAMETGIGVQSDPSDPRGKNCFGRDFVMISHSTGAIIADVALSIANKTKTDINLKTQYGDIGLISDRCKGRVSIQGAYSGSNLAKIAVIGAQAFPELFGFAMAAIAFHPISAQTINTIASTPQIIANSILVDLVPEITRSRWGSYINDISVPVLTLAGGHPSAILGPLKYNILPGFDDGVLTMDCANGNNNPLSFGPSSINATPNKIFDMGIALIRAINYYKDRKISEGVFATASTAYLSPTGMVEPVNSINMNPQNHFNNHYSFVQASKEHWFATTELGSGNTPCDYKETLFGGSTNNDEVMVVTNPNLFTPGLIDPAIISQMGESIKDLHIDYPWLKVVIRHGIPKITVFWKRFYIWKRTYHKLNDNCMYDVDYAYKYLFN